MVGTMRQSRRLASSFMLGLTIVSALSAQEYRKNDFTIDLPVESGTDSRGSRHLYGGLGGIYNYNLSSHIALEANVAYISGFQRGEFADEGQELLASAGVKAGWRFRHVGLFGRLSPGVASFDQGIGVARPPATAFTYFRRTHFALEDGGTFEYYPSPHSLLRLDMGETLLAEFDQVVQRSPKELVGGHVAQHLSLRLGVGYRFGNVTGSSNHEDTDSSTQQPGRAQVGILYALHIKEHLLLQNLTPDQGVGIWADYAFAPWLGLDGSVFYLPKNDRQINFQDGGQALEAYLGFRSGMRRKRVGIYAKVRPGFVQFAHVISSLHETPSTYSAQYGRFLDPALDIGGIFEAYPARHWVIRTEAGDDLLFYRQRTIPINEQLSNVPAQSRASLLFLCGLGVRF